MQSKKCGNCGKDIPKTAVSCPHCGSKIQKMPFLKKVGVGCLVLIGLSILYTIGTIMEENQKIGETEKNSVTQKNSGKKSISVDSANYLLKTHIVGIKYEPPKSLEMVAEFGSPVTLPGTDNQKWLAYFPKGNFTIYLDKKSKRILAALYGQAQDIAPPIDIKNEFGVVKGKRGLKVKGSYANL